MSLFKFSSIVYKAVDPVGPFAERAFNFLLALALIILGSPIFLLVGLMVYLSDGRPIIYRGKRLGRAKKPFTMYKFRTLKQGAQVIIGGQLLSHEHNLII